MTKTLILGLFLALPGPSWCDEIAISQFGGLNNSVDPVVISQGESQDLLNVETNKTGTGIRKRDGFSEVASVSTSAVSVKSLFGFKSPIGNDCVISVDSAGVVKKMANLTTPVHVTTITVGARLYCMSSEGTAYCFSSANDVPFRHNCTSLSMAVEPYYPNGKFNAFTLDRQLVAGTTDYPNRVHISQSGAYSTFSTGSEDFSAWYEDVGTAGDKITGLYYLNGRVIVAKEYGILGLNLGDQFDTQGFGISERVGISNPEAMVIHDGKGYFKGSDNEFYVITGSPGQIEKISQSISSTTSNLLSGKSRYLILTEKADWDGGELGVGGTGISASIISGSILPSSVTLLDNTTSLFNQGSCSGCVVNSSAIIQFNAIESTYPTVYSGDALPTADGWSYIPTHAPNVQSVAGSSLTATCYAGYIECEYYRTPAVSSANIMAVFRMAPSLRNKDIRSGFLAIGHNEGTSYGKSAEIAFSSSAVRYYSSGSYYVEELGTVGYSTYTIIVTTDAKAFMWRNGVFKASGTATTSTYGNDSVIFGMQPSIDQATIYVDSIYISTAAAYPTAADIVSIATFTSRIWDTKFTTSTFGILTYSSFTVSNSTITFSARVSTSPNNDMWGAYEEITYGNRYISGANRYMQYRATFSANSLLYSPRISTISITAASLDKYITPCLSVGSGISAWGIIQTGGIFDNGYHTVELSTGATCATSGGYWTSASTGATIALATAPALKARISLYINSTTNTARVDELIVNWSEGSVAPPTPSAYWDDGIYWGVSSVNTGSNNATIKLDTLHGGWFIFDIAMESIVSVFNSFYFGGVSAPKIFKFSDVNKVTAPKTDNGAVISARWKSKSLGGNPFTENTLDKISIVAKKESGGSITSTWKTNGGDTGNSSYSVSLSTGTNVVRSNYNVPFGARGTFWDLEISNSSIYPFEILGIKFDYTPKAWRPLP